MIAYYNEIDQFAAQWLRNLIQAGQIAPGHVDERSIEDVKPSDLTGFTQCHFFAGIGIWSLALRRAGWPDDRPIWTGSCPCQPFSAAGAGAGFSDERHLWPAFFHLIEQCRPAAILGEQVASKDANPWINLVQADMEALGYGFGAVPFPAASVGAPHIRDRLYWVANASGTGLERHARDDGSTGWQRSLGSTAEASVLGGLADMHSDGCDQAGQCESKEGGDGSERYSTTLGLADAQQHGCGCEAKPANYHWPQTNRPTDKHGRHSRPPAARPSPVNGFWADADWLLCRDGKWRPVEPGTFPLVDGYPQRVGILRAAGNAIVAPQAQIFIETVMEYMP